MLEFKIKLTLSLIAFAFLIDAYSWQAYKTLYNKRNKNVRRTIAIAFWAIPIIVSAVLLGSFFFSEMDGNKAYRVYFTGFYFIFYLSKFFICIFMLLDDVKRLITVIFRKIKELFETKAEAELEEYEAEVEEKSDKITRSEFLARTGLIAGAVPFVILTRGIMKGAYDYRVHKVELYLPNLPDAFEGLKIVQISDVHSGSFTDKDAVYKGIKLIKEQNADLAFFTGDFVNNKTDEAYDWMDLFAEMKAPMGVYSILGNHDYGDYVNNWKSPEEKQKNLTDLYDVHKQMGWHLMRNEHVVIDRKFNKIGLIGVENWGDRGRFQKYGNVEVAQKGMENTPVKLLLSHDPSHFDTIVSQKHKDIDVTFSGHTHGFQFGVELGKFKWSPSQYIYPHWAGLYETKENQKLYVNRGYGFLGYPGRVGILPEITVFTLTNSI